MTKKKSQSTAKTKGKNPVKDPKAGGNKTVPEEKTGTTSGTSPETNQDNPEGKDQLPISDEQLQKAHGSKDEPEVEQAQPGIPEGFRRFEAQDFLTALAEVREEIAETKFLAGQVPKRDHTHTVEELKSGLINVPKTKKS